MDTGLDEIGGVSTPSVEARRLLSARSMGLLLLWSTTWTTFCVGLWALTLFLSAGGFPQANLLILALAVVGPPLGLFAGGLAIGLTAAFTGLLPHRLALLAACLLAWACALVAWALLVSPTYLGPFGVALSGCVAIAGLLVSLAAVWPREHRRRQL